MKTNVCFWSYLAQYIPAMKDCNGRIIRQYSAARAIFFIYRVKTQTIHSPPILKQLGEGLKR